MSDSKNKHRYKQAEGKRWIEVRIKSPLQLFDARDPAPFRERELDDDFVEYITTSAREFSIASPLKIVIYIEEEEKKDLSRESIREAIQSYLAYHIDLQRSGLKSHLKMAQAFLLIGLAILAACVAAAQNIEATFPASPMGVLREGLVIFGWVSMWKPIELVMFDWYPMFAKLRFYKKLLQTEIDIRFSTGSPSY